MLVESEYVYSRVLQNWLRLLVKVFTQLITTMETGVRFCHLVLQKVGVIEDVGAGVTKYSVEETVCGYGGIREFHIV